MTWESPWLFQVAIRCSFGRNQGSKGIRNAKSGVKQLELGQVWFINEMEIGNCDL